MQRYSRYRDNIRRLPDDAFEEDGKFGSKLTQKDLKALSNMGYSGSAISFASKSGKNANDLTPDEEKESPYSYYLNRKRLVWLVKIIVALLVAGGLAAFYFFFVVAR